MGGGVVHESYSLCTCGQNQFWGCTFDGVNVFACMKGDIHHRWFRSLLLHPMLFVCLLFVSVPQLSLQGSANAGSEVSCATVFPHTCGSGGFFLACQDLGECSTIYSQPVLFFSSFLVEISSHTLIPLFRPGSVHSDSASWDDCDRVFPNNLCVSSFPDRFSHYAWTVA